MKSKIVLFSDWHAHPFAQFSNSNIGGMNSRLQDAFDVLHQIKNYVEENSKDVLAVFFGGDLFHVRNTINVVTWNAVIYELKLFIDSLTSLGIEFHLIVGNHDDSSRSGDSTSLDFIQHLGVPSKRSTMLYKAPTIATVGGSLKTCFVPYTEDSRAVLDVVAEKSDLFLGHMGIQGSDLGSDFVYKNQNDWNFHELNPQNFDVMMMGHFHKNQALAEHAYYIGAPLHHNFGDEGQKRGFVVYDIETKEHKHIETKFPKFITITDAMIDQDLSFTNNNYLRIKTKNKKDFAAVMKAYEPKAFEIIEVLDKDVGLDENYSIPELNLGKEIETYLSKLADLNKLNKGELLTLAKRFM